MVASDGTYTSVPGDHVYVAIQNASSATENVTSSLPTNLTPGNIVISLLVLGIAYVVARSLSLFFTVIADSLAKNRFRVTSLIPLVKFVVYGTAAYVIVTFLFEFSTTQLVAFSGLLGAALGFGLKDFFADIVGGLVIVVEQPYQVGDKVSIGDHYGEIVDIGIRSTKLVTPYDNLVVVPNFLFFQESIANANTSDAQMMVAIEFHIDPDADVRRAKEIVEEALITSKYVYVSNEYPVSVLVDDDLYYRTLTGRAYVNDLRNEYSFKTDVSERVLEKFSEEGIESPKLPAGGTKPDEL